MRRKFLTGLSFAIMMMLCISVSQATTLTAHLTTDDAFNLYISTDDTQLGTLVGGHSWWYDTQTLTAALTPNVTNYIHIVGWDLYRVIAGLLGDFTLSDTDFQFTNGTQELVTNAGNWNVYTDHFGGTLGTITEQGANGVGPWGYQSLIDPQARWIWTGGGHDFQTRYFSAAINTAAPAPEPATMLLVGTGLIGLAGVSRKKFKK